MFILTLISIFILSIIMCMIFCHLLLWLDVITLWTDHGRRHTSPGRLAVRHWISRLARARQLSAHHRRVARAPDGLPEPASHRALRLSAHHARRHPTTQGALVFLKFNCTDNSSCLFRTRLLTLSQLQVHVHVCHLMFAESPAVTERSRVLCAVDAAAVCRWPSP